MSEPTLTVHLTHRCPECGHEYSSDLTPDQAREHATTVLAAADNLPIIEAAA